jgi:hypothetical protein
VLIVENWSLEPQCDHLWQQIQKRAKSSPTKGTKVHEGNLAF